MELDIWVDNTVFMICTLSHNISPKTSNKEYEQERIENILVILRLLSGIFEAKEFLLDLSVPYITTLHNFKFYS